MSLRAVEYEVHGIVQGVWFRAHTQDKARQLGVVGWVMNTSQGTVKGEVQGRDAAVEEMKDWLATKGSPHSVIERCEFRNERELEALEYSSFSTKRR
ncbi:hypothetical protein CHLNCDRAFT_144371 [Chlorella variabilis]|uniref:Acylphosphatase n=1 Tax=Chlorella variabilis TaxID=554065 RepID=E1ZBA5_CHLVA|nr:hypothetical protein CHLNCDRAFT_144371 [Chlorella variabilis]EFN56611.1 hypothetical protein CHLNCDRAFT_144371 [Chlorella variabilis]|eukprot:XP_005848713.1 hypothetical protein CHLNCDRAFT_144371 [Chlorella variabilis]